MFRITQITSDPLQRQSVILPDGTAFSITMYYIPLQTGWFVRNLTYNNFVLTNFRIVDSPNIINQFRHQIPFGLACYTKDNREPTLQDDFVSGNSKLYVLSQAECVQFAEFLNGQT